MIRAHGVEHGGLIRATPIVTSFLVFSLSISYLVVQIPSAAAATGTDYIQIRSAPGNGGVVIHDKSYYVGDTDDFWAAAYNYSSGYIGDVGVYWWSTKSSVGTVDTAGNRTTFHAVGEGVTQVGAYYYEQPPWGTIRPMNMTGNLTVLYRGVDYLNIRDAPNGGGDIVATRTYFVGDTAKLYAAGYNFTLGYVGDLLAIWASSNETVCNMTGGALAAVFTALHPGVCKVTAVYDAAPRNTTGDLTVKDIPGIPRPPTMMKAELTGSTYSDVTLTWSSSPDDDGTGNVTEYRILKSEMIGGPFTVVASVIAAGSPTYAWADFDAGHGDPHNYFYYVVASSPFHDSPPTRLAGKFSRTLEAGKQLVSIPLEQADYAPTVVFQTFDFIYARTYVAGTPNPWWCHKPGRFINSLTHLSIIQGYWVQLETPGIMTVAGLVPMDSIIDLKSGWNMIGFPSFRDSYTFADLDSAIGGMLQLVEFYDPGAGPYNLQTVHRNAWSTMYLHAGLAYMIRVSNDVNWLVP